MAHDRIAEQRIGKLDRKVNAVIAVLVIIALVAVLHLAAWVANMLMDAKDQAKRLPSKQPTPVHGRP